MSGLKVAPCEQVHFLWNKLVCLLHVENEFLHITCVKKINALNPRPLSAYNKRISLLHVLSVSCEKDEWKVDEKAPSLMYISLGNLLQMTNSSCVALKISLSVKCKNHCQKLQILRLRTYRETDCLHLCNLINFELNNTLNAHHYVRPQHLLVFVNPYGGKRKAEIIHKKVVSPIFKEAGVKETVIVTKYRNHAREYVASENLSCYDGVIAVGGDGMASEIINGLLVLEQNKRGIKMNGDSSLLRVPINYAKSSLRVGVIPAGSTNCLCYVAVGKDDPETAALQIVSGENHPLDICSIHDGHGKFIRFSFSMTSYGYMGTVLKQSELMRNFGPSRYDIAGAKSFIKLRAYPSEVTYLPSSGSNPVDVSIDNSKCRYPCAVCSADVSHNNILSTDSLPEQETPTCSSFSCHSNQIDYVEAQSTSNHTVHNRIFKCLSFKLKESNSLSKAQPSTSTGLNELSTANVGESIQADDTSKTTSYECNNQWKVARGNFVMVSSAMMSCACARCPKGLSPSAHLSDGNVDLILIQSSSRANFLRYLISHTGEGNRFDFPFVQVHRVKGFHHRLLCKSFLDANCKVKQTDKINLSIDSQIKLQDDPSMVKHLSCWNSDGEVIENPNISLWVHRGLVNIFARGIED